MRSHLFVVEDEGAEKVVEAPQKEEAVHADVRVEHRRKHAVEMGAGQRSDLHSLQPPYGRAGQGRAGYGRGW